MCAPECKTQCFVFVTKVARDAMFPPNNISWTACMPGATALHGAREPGSQSHVATLAAARSCYPGTLLPLLTGRSEQSQRRSVHMCAEPQSTRNSKTDGDLGEDIWNLRIFSTGSLPPNYTLATQAARCHHNEIF